MVDEVSIFKKKNFIEWFLKRFHLKQRESVWILNYLMGKNELLEHVKFVDELPFEELDSSGKRGMIISATNGNNFITPFRFFKGRIVTNNAEKAFHDMRLHPDEDIYIELNFNGKDKCPEYMAVSESYNSRELLSQSVLEEAESVISGLEHDLLLKAIDRALDNGDQKLFMELCGRLKQVDDKEIVSVG